MLLWYFLRLAVVVVLPLAHASRLLSTIPAKQRRLCHLTAQQYSTKSDIADCYQQKALPPFGSSLAAAAAAEAAAHFYAAGNTHTNTKYQHRLKTQADAQHDRWHSSGQDTPLGVPAWQGRSRHLLQAVAATYCA